MHGHARFGREWLAVERVVSRCPGAAAVGPWRGHPPTLGEERGGTRHQRLVATHHAVAAAIPATAAAATAHGVLHHTQRVRALEAFHRRIAGVAHAHMHRVGASTTMTRALPAAECFVETPSRCTQRDVVHGTLPARRYDEIMDAHAGGSRRQRGEAHIGETLGQLHVACRDGAGALGVGHTIVGDDEMQRAGHPVVHWHIVVAQHTQHEHSRSAGHSGRRIHVAAHGGRRSREIEMQRAVAYFGAYDYRNGVITHAVAFECVGRRTDCPVEQSEPRAHATLGVVEQRIHGGLQCFLAHACDERLPTRTTGRARRALRPQIALAFIRCAHVGEQQRHDVALWLTLHLNAHRRHDDAFLIQLGGSEWHAPRADAAHIGVVRAYRRVPHDARSVVRMRNDLHHGEIGQMRAAVRGVIEQKHLARFGTSGANSGHRLGHGTQMNGNVRRLRHHTAGRVEQRARGITPLTNVR